MSKSYATTYFKNQSFSSKYCLVARRLRQQRANSLPTLSNSRKMDQDSARLRQKTLKASVYFLIDSEARVDPRRACCTAHAVRAGRVCVGGAPEFQQKLSHLRAFFREFLRVFERRSCAISVPTAVKTQPRDFLTPCMLRSTRSARRLTFAWAMR